MIEYEFDNIKFRVTKNSQNEIVMYWFEKIPWYTEWQFVSHSYRLANPNLEFNIDDLLTGTQHHLLDAITQSDMFEVDLKNEKLILNNYAILQLL